MGNLLLRNGLVWEYHQTFSSRLLTAHTDRQKATVAAQLARVARVSEGNSFSVPENGTPLGKRSPLVM